MQNTENWANNGHEMCGKSNLYLKEENVLVQQGLSTKEESVLVSITIIVVLSLD